MSYQQVPPDPPRHPVPDLPPQPYSHPPQHSPTALAGWALGLAIVGCCFIGNIISTFLAIATLRHRSAPGISDGKGMAVAALAINSVNAGILAVFLYAAFAVGLVFEDNPSLAKDPVNADPRIVTSDTRLDPGDCLLSPSIRNGSAGPDRRVPCTSRHDAEVTFTFVLKGDRYPGDRAVDRRAERCTAAPFRRYVGVPYDESRLDGLYYSPTKATWAIGDRHIVCLISDPGQRPTESLKGSRR